MAKQISFVRVWKRATLVLRRFEDEEEEANDAALFLEGIRGATTADANAVVMMAVKRAGAALEISMARIQRVFFFERVAGGRSC